MQFILLGLLGAAAGVFSGLFGLGGAVVVVPALVFIFGFSQHSAQGTSLAMLLPPIGLLAVWRYWQAGYVNIGIAAVLAVAFFIGAAIGAHFAVQIPQLMMKRLFSIVIAIIGIIMFVTAK
jgi:uncharacterized protein